MGKFKTASMKKKIVWPAYPVEFIDYLKDEFLGGEAVQAAMANELQKGNHWMAILMIQFSDGSVNTQAVFLPTQEESRAARRAMAETAQRIASEGRVGHGHTRYLASWNFGIADASKWMETLPEA